MYCILKPTWGTYSSDPPVPLSPFSLRVGLLQQCMMYEEPNYLVVCFKIVDFCLVNLDIIFQSSNKVTNSG